MKAILAFALVATAVIVASAGEANSQPASANDTARVLAGIQPSYNSPLLVLTKDPAWQQHVNNFNSLFAKVENRQLTRIRAWSRAKLTSPNPVLFYMFSGPDFLYANAFFPNASTYVMSGLETTGPIPDLTKLSREARGRTFRNIEQSLSSIAAYGFFQTLDMRHNLAATGLTGTLPILYVFLARSGKTITHVSLVRLDDNGTAQVDDGDGSDARGVGIARGVKIDFVGDDRRPQTLYYFSVNVDNDGFEASGFARFCKHLGTGDGFVKSASYLMHRANFSNVRSFLLQHTRLIVQDDSGIPIDRFDQASWQLHPFGHYSGPIALFANRYQSKLSELFSHRAVESIDFAIGYRWHPGSSNLIVAARTYTAIPMLSPAQHPVRFLAKVIATLRRRRTRTAQRKQSSASWIRRCASALSSGRHVSDSTAILRRRVALSETTRLRSCRICSRNSLISTSSALAIVSTFA